jgi:hypothetical protein
MYWLSRRLAKDVPTVLHAANVDLDKMVHGVRRIL